MTRRAVLAGSAIAAAGRTEAQPALEPDIVIIGAGAAGIAAARRIIAAGRTVTLIEAKDRAGGRCLTSGDPFGMPMDLGAHWLHASADNSLVPLARQLGFDLYPAPSRERLMIAGRAPRENEREGFISALRRTERAILQAGEAGREVSMASVIPDVGDWRTTVEFLKGAWDCGKDPADISCVDFYNAIEGGDLFCRQGYGAILARLASNLPIRLSTRATRIDWSGRGVAVETSAGTVRARVAIVTVSTAVLASGRLAFAPALPRRQAEAIAALSLGAYEHLIIELPGDPVQAEADEPFTFRASGPRTAKGLARIGGSNWWYLDIGGAFARELANAGQAAMADYAGEIIAAELGVRARRALGRVVSTAWSLDPDVRGSWSVAGPGATGQRLRLAEPVGDRILFAGEALDEGLWGTVGGAWDSGERAAERALRWIVASTQRPRR